MNAAASTPLATTAARTVPVTTVADVPTGTTQAVWDTSRPMPTQAEPQLALVMVPHQEGT